jgi:adenylylsulfate kinase
MSGAVVWLTGLSGAGKTTLATALSRTLQQAGRSVEILDGDRIRQAFSADLGYSKADRDLNVRRLGFLAALLSKHGVVVIVAAISPYRAVRDEVRRLQEAMFVEVHVDCPLDVLRARDPKGLYEKAMRGDIKDFTGISAPYEPPLNPECRLRTDLQSVDECVSAILERLPTIETRHPSHAP